MRFILSSTFFLLFLGALHVTPRPSFSEEAAAAAGTDETQPAAAAGGDEAADAKAPVPVRFGTTEEALRERFGSALREEPVEEKKHPGYAFMEEKMRARKLPGESDAEDSEPLVVQNPFEGQKKLVRTISGGDIVAAEYDLYKGKVYGIRWKLAERFERTIIEDYVAAATERYGTPDYDQYVGAKFGSGKVDLRRAGWSRKDKLLEVRQLDPNSGGPVYVMIADRTVYRAIVAAKGVVAPAPDTMKAWWERPARQYQPMTKGERETLLAAFGAVLDRTGF